MHLVVEMVMVLLLVHTLFLRLLLRQLFFLNFLLVALHFVRDVQSFANLGSKLETDQRDLNDEHDVDKKTEQFQVDRNDLLQSFRNVSGISRL